MHSAVFAGCVPNRQMYANQNGELTAEHKKWYPIVMFSALLHQYICDP